MRVTILEGPDGTGKTTLARSKAFDDGTVIKLDQTHAPHMFEVVMRSIVGARRAGVRHLVFDRSHLSERIYGPRYREGSQISPAASRLLDRALLYHQAVLVMGLPSKVQAVANWSAKNTKGEEYVTKQDKYEAIYDDYRFAVRLGLTHLPVLYYDYRVDPANVVRDQVEALRPEEPQSRGSGEWLPGGTLLVGEAPSPRAAFPDYAFVENSGCSLWMAEQLETNFVGERHKFWVNASQASDNILETLMPMKVVALGQKAAAWAAERGAGDGLEVLHVIAHPQYWKRFMTRKPYRLMEVLR